MYDVHTNLTPSNIKNIFKKPSSVHSYRTRSVTNSINLLVVYRESVNLIGYISRRLSADSLQL